MGEEVRVASFSYKPLDTNATQAVQYLREHGNKKGISFSRLVLNAIKLYVKELKNGS